MRGTDPINSTWVYPNFVKLQIAIKHVGKAYMFFYFYFAIG